MVSCFGIGVHSGRPTSLSLSPAPINSGITFIRTDITEEGINNKIHAKYDGVSKVRLGTTIKNCSGIEISTIEHLMAALWGCNIDNVVIEVDGPEIPAMDGSAEPFVFMIECAGFQIQDAPRKRLKILKEVCVKEEGGAMIKFVPNDHFCVDMKIQFDTKVISTQEFSFSEREKSFKHEIARARTFGFKHEEEALKSRGFAQGASLENVIVINNEKILNTDGLRYKDEFVRHKLLDLIGDFYLAGGPIQGTVRAFKTGHALNNRAIHTLIADSSSYEFVYR
jgi:UDP-3-O-[3-hydroxymyristoyl] N-acetylglucosamine deacetylase